MLHIALASVLALSFSSAGPDGVRKHDKARIEQVVEWWVDGKPNERQWIVRRIDSWITRDEIKWDDVFEQRNYDCGKLRSDAQLGQGYALRVGDVKLYMRAHREMGLIQQVFVMHEALRPPAKLPPRVHLDPLTDEEIATLTSNEAWFRIGALVGFHTSNRRHGVPTPEWVREERKLMVELVIELRREQQESDEEQDR